MTQDAGEKAFTDAYTALNKAQKEAVDTIEGPVLVVAGPGTGKTQILTLRIVNILRQTDVAPEQILALTFTESGVTAMRERLRRYLGATAYRVPIHTFHGFAGQLIAQYPDAFPRVIGGTVATDLDKVTMIESILDGGAVNILRPAGNPQYYVTPLLREISKLKQEYCTPDRLAALNTELEALLKETPQYHESGAHKGKVRSEYTKREKQLEKNRALHSVYLQYEALLQSERRYDFDDMLVAAVTAMEENEDLLRDLQETYQYVLADEHQDVNGVQNTLLETLVSYHETPNIFAVGDEKQAIYRFQGASLENFLYFEERFTGTKTISLTENYRSGQSILDAAHSLVAVEEGPLASLRLPLMAKAVSSSQITVQEFYHQAVEDDWVVKTVKQAVAKQVPLSEIAVIVRTNREVEQLAGELRRADIAVNASADGDILTHPITNHIIELLEAVVYPERVTALARVLHAPYWGISTSDVLQLLSAQDRNTTLLALVNDEKRLSALGLVDPSKIQEMVATLTSVRSAATHQTPHQVLEQLLHDSGYLAHLISSDPLEGVRVVRRLYDEVESLVTYGEVTSLHEVLNALKQRKEYGLALTAPYIATNQSAVTVMTAHKAKGLEFEVVIMPHLVDSVWGGATRAKLFDVNYTRLVHQDEFEAIDDERRLLFVGMTRAKHTLYLSSSQQNSEGKALVQSRLLSEIDPSTYEVVATEAVAADFSISDALQNPLTPIAVDTEVLVELLRTRGFSATSFNNYLRSPWDYVYRNLLRLPETQNLSMQYGTAIHSVLEKYVRQRSDTAWPTFSEAETWLKEALNRLPLSDTEYTTLHERALKSLASYLPHLEASAAPDTKVEQSVTVMLETGVSELPEIPLKGTLDRIDMNSAGGWVRVVDYKTGKPKTKNAIMGKTKNDDGGYYRQLVFYALLFSLHEDTAGDLPDGVLSFVEPATNGTTKEEVFTITMEEVEALKAEISEAVRFFTSGAIKTAPCDPEQSSYCDLVATLQD